MLQVNHTKAMYCYLLWPKLHIYMTCTSVCMVNMYIWHHSGGNNIVQSLPPLFSMIPGFYIQAKGNGAPKTFWSLVHLPSQHSTTIFYECSPYTSYSSQNSFDTGKCFHWKKCPQHRLGPCVSFCLVLTQCIMASKVDGVHAIMVLRFLSFKLILSLDIVIFL